MTTEHGAAYSAAKAGILALTRVAAAENGRHGIRVNAVAPGLIYNEFLRRIYPDEFFDGYAESRSLVGRVGQPEDVADLVSFLVSDRAGYTSPGRCTASAEASLPMPERGQREPALLADRLPDRGLPAGPIVSGRGGERGARENRPTESVCSTPISSASMTLRGGRRARPRRPTGLAGRCR